MPVEIRELVIRTVVSDAVIAQHSPQRSGQQHAPLAQVDIDQLVQECVRQVLLVLARERAR